MKPTFTKYEREIIRMVHSEVSPDKYFKIVYDAAEHNGQWPADLLFPLIRKLTTKPKPDPKPSIWGHELWRHIHDEHGLTLTQSELNEILEIARKLTTKPKRRKK